MAAAVLHRVQDSKILVFECPGCGCGHHIDPDRWTWNGDLVRPTVSPSLLVHLGGGRRCHSFVRDGRIQFLSDCTHSLAGQTVDIPRTDDDAGQIRRKSGEPPEGCTCEDDTCRWCVWYEMNDYLVDGVSEADQ